MTTILGLSAFYHDSAAALVIDGQIVAAAQEERFSRIKHDASFPKRAIEHCLAIAELSSEDVDYVAFYEKPFLKFERILETHLDQAPLSLNSFLDAMPQWMRSKLFIARTIAKQIDGYDRKAIFPEHHESHSASAFFPSPFERAAILTVDGVGEWATTTLGVGENNRIQLTDEIRFPDSLGLLYSAFTAFCGFRVNGGEGKLMGLAPYGEPVYEDAILDQVVDVQADGSFRLNQDYFAYLNGTRMTSPKFSQLFGGPARTPEAPITDREQNLAASIQRVTEMILLSMAEHLHRKTGLKNLCLAGGVALNCVANGRLLRESSFENVWVQPAAGDSGAALGAALFVAHQLLDQPRMVQPDQPLSMFLGPSHSDDQITDIIYSGDAVVRRFENVDSLYQFVAEQLSQQKIVGWSQGRMEFGPRALGGRSILADPRSPTMKDRLNDRVKFREPFRPFAPVVLESKSNAHFHLDRPSPYMTLAAQVRDTASQESQCELPATTHVDGSARVQTVGQFDGGSLDGSGDPCLSGLLEKFESVTGCSVLVNTSFNVRGEPIVNDVMDAYQCFLKTDLDILVVGQFVLCKQEQLHLKAEVGRMAAMRSERDQKPRVSIWRRMFAAWQAITFPIRWLVSTLVLALVYFLLVTPIGALRRGWRNWNRKHAQIRNETSSSNWQARSPQDDPERYFKQF